MPSTFMELKLKQCTLLVTPRVISFTIAKVNRKRINMKFQLRLIRNTSMLRTSIDVSSQVILFLSEAVVDSLREQLIKCFLLLTDLGHFLMIQKYSAVTNTQ